MRTIERIHRFKRDYGRESRGRHGADLDERPAAIVQALCHTPTTTTNDDDKRSCDGVQPSRHIVLGTDFITDIAFFSMRVEPPISLKPGHTSTAVALRTLSEALAKAACAG